MCLYDISALYIYGQCWPRHRLLEVEKGKDGGDADKESEVIETILQPDHSSLLYIFHRDNIHWLVSLVLLG